MIERIKKLVELVTSPNTEVLVGDDYVINVMMKGGHKPVVTINLPTVTRGEELGARERGTVVMRVLKKSVLDKSYTDELNVLNDCEQEADMIMRKAMCQLDVSGYQKSFVLKLFDGVLSGVELTFTL